MLSSWLTRIADGKEEYIINPGISARPDYDFLGDLWNRREDAEEVIKSKAQQFPIVNKINITSVSGLKEDARKHPFLWKGEFGNMAPDVIRWIWNPQTGEMIINAHDNHAQMVPRKSKFGEWVRGFYLPARKMVLVRPYFNPQKKGKFLQDWNEEHSATNDRVMSVIYGLLIGLMRRIPGLKVQLNIGNNDVKQLTGRANV
jgi:hypothetical protein